jgi:hypothetical protein
MNQIKKGTNLVTRKLIVGLLKRKEIKGKEEIEKRRSIMKNPVIIVPKNFTR